MEDNIKIFIVQKYKLWLLSYDSWEPVYCSTDLPTAVIVTPSASVQYVHKTYQNSLRYIQTWKINI
jgi:hypothetical protein